MPHYSPARSTVVVAIAAALVVALITALTTAVTTPPAGAQVSDTDEDRFLGAGTYQLINVDLDRYLASAGDSNRSNVVTVQAVSDRTSWDITDNGDGTWLLQNVATGGWLDGDGRWADWNVDQSTAPRSDDRWIIEDVGNGEWSLTNAERHRLLDADRGHQDWNVDLARSLRGDRKWTFEFVDAPSGDVCRGLAASQRGMSIVASRSDFETTWSALEQVVTDNPNLRIIGRVDHAAAAAGAGLTLEPNRVLFFGNPAIGTPLMADNRSAGIDLPQKMQVWQSGGAVCVGYNQADYLQARHILGDLPQLDVITGALANIAFAVSGAPANNQAFDGLFLQAVTPSDADFETTWSRLLAAIDASPASVAFTVDHGANSGGVLEPTRLVVFGNPNLGTPLMQASATAGIDLPLKILVYERSGEVFILGSDVDFVASRHRIDGADAALDRIRGAITNFVTIASESAAS